MKNTEAIKIELIDRLKTISTDRDFLIGVVSNAKHNDDRLSIIEYINNGDDVSYENVLLLSVWLAQEREKKGI